MEEHYLKILQLLIPDESDRNTLFQKISIVEQNPASYEDIFFRMPDEDDDIVWLEMVDSLIKNNYAFEIDWKDDYGDTEEYINELLFRNNIEFQLNGNMDSEEEAEIFFPMVNEILAHQYFCLLNLDIDSDSYVSIISTLDSAEILVDLDCRISIYKK